MQRFRSSYKQFRSLGAQVLGLSTDPPALNKEFCNEQNLPFPVLSDPGKGVARRYGVLNEDSGMARRVTFVIDKQGIVRSVEEGMAALSPQGALDAVQKLKH